METFDELVATAIRLIELFIKINTKQQEVLENERIAIRKLIKLDQQPLRKWFWHWRDPNRLVRQQARLKELKRTRKDPAYEINWAKEAIQCLKANPININTSSALLTWNMADVFTKPPYDRQYGITRDYLIELNHQLHVQARALGYPVL